MKSKRKSKIILLVFILLFIINTFIVINYNVKAEEKNESSIYTVVGKDNIVESKNDELEENIVMKKESENNICENDNILNNSKENRNINSENNNLNYKIDNKSDKEDDDIIINDMTYFAKEEIEYEDNEEQEEVQIQKEEIVETADKLEQFIQNIIYDLNEDININDNNDENVISLPLDYNEEEEEDENELTEKSDAETSDNYELNKSLEL